MSPLECYKSEFVGSHLLYGGAGSEGGTGRGVQGLRGRGYSPLCSLSLLLRGGWGRACIERSFFVRHVTFRSPWRRGRGPSFLDRQNITFFLWFYRVKGVKGVDWLTSSESICRVIRSRVFSERVSGFLLFLTLLKGIQRNRFLFYHRVWKEQKVSVRYSQAKDVIDC